MGERALSQLFVTFEARQGGEEHRHFYSCCVNEKGLQGSSLWLSSHILLPDRLSERERVISKPLYYKSERPLVGERVFNYLFRERLRESFHGSTLYSVRKRE